MRSCLAYLWGMNHIIISAFLVFLASNAFCGPGTVDTSHAQGGYDYEDIAVALVVSPYEAGTVWLSAKYSYPLILSERDKLLSYIQTAARQIDIAVANETTISYQQVVGRFYTNDGALLTVSFETAGFELSYSVVRIQNSGNNVILLLDKKDTRD
jgi:hypothetical protein